jgi:tRNA G18 (ribose-2'-O)-methylase SpoU
MKTRLLTSKELRQFKPVRATFRAMKRHPLHLILDGVGNASNLGNIFRVADAVLAEKVWLWGSSVALEGPKFRKSAKSMWRWVPCELRPAIHAIAELKGRGVRILAVDLVEGGQAVTEADLSGPVAFIFGNESSGISEGALDLCDGAVHLPMLGMGNSINVATSAAVMAYAWLGANPKSAIG